MTSKIVPSKPYRTFWGCSIHNQHIDCGMILNWEACLEDFKSGSKDWEDEFLTMKEHLSIQSLVPWEDIETRFVFPFCCLPVEPFDPILGKWLGQG